MKKLFIAIIAICALCSCTKDNPQWQEMTGNTIGFAVAPAVPQVSKVTDDAFDNGDPLSVFGYLVKNDGTVVYPTPYISAFNFTYATGTSDYTSPYFWPKFNSSDYKALRFYAYYSKPSAEGTGPVLVTTDNDAPYFTYKTNVAGAAATEDFLVAQSEASANNVKLQFMRPLAKVIWKVRNKDWIGTLGMNVLMNVISEADFYYSSSLEENVKGWILSDVFSNFTINYKDQIDGDATDETEATEIGICYLIPQTIQTFAVVYNYHKEKVDLKDSPLELSPGNEYTITLVIGKDKVIAVETSDGKQEWITYLNENKIELPSNN